MRLPHRLVFLLPSLAVLAAGTVPAQPLPASPEIQVNTYTRGLQAASGVAADADGNVTVVWESGGPPSPGPTQDGSGAGIFLRRFDPSGAPLTGEIQVNQLTQGDQRIPSVSSSPEGNLVVAWWSEIRDPETGDYRITAQARRVTPDGQPAGPEFQLATSDGSYEYFPVTAFCPDGSFAAIWQRYRPSSDESAILLRRFDASGAPLGDEARISSDGSPSAGYLTHGYPDVACDLQGRLLVVWEVCCDLAAEQSEIRLRRFAADGSALGGEIRVDTDPGRKFSPSVGVAPDGSFAVAWDLYSQVWARRFRADGHPVSAARLVSTNLFNVTEGGAQALMDDSGNLLLAWSSENRDGSGYGVYGRWYDPSGAEKGGLFRLNTTTPHDQAGVRVALQPGGFFAIWTSGLYGGPEPSPGQDGDGWGAIARRFVFPPPGAEPCSFGPDGLACDFLHDGADGGDSEAAVPFGEPGDRPLAGNPDGDSRDDLCVYRNGRFLCDTGHDGGAAEIEIAFGAAGDVPLLGDVNGDGRDDACVRRGRRFACDTAHNGGTAEVQIVFGRFADTPLLGDLDGDGDDEPCLFRAGLFLCDTVHDGRTAEAVIAFGQGGDLPLLGDVDGDGDDDPCVVRGGRFFCDTAHDGGSAEVVIDFGEDGGAGSVPLLGNFNGI